MKYDRKNIRDSIINSQIVPKEPYIYPMSALRDEEIFRYFLNRYINYVDCIVETGTYLGISALLLNQYCNTLHTFDIKDFPEREKIWDFGNINEEMMCGGNVFFHLIKDDKEKKEIIKKIGKIDFSWIDGRHHGGCDIDFEILRPYCNKFLFHDYCPSKAKLNGKGLYDYVFTFIQSIRKDAKIVDIKEPFIYLEF